MRIRPLPRSLDPLPMESLPGYLLRLAHRLGLSPARIGTLTGLSARSAFDSLPGSHMFALDETTTSAFAHATRLSGREIAALTLARFAARYPFLDLAFCGRDRTIRGMLVKENWVFFRASRYCPDCLAGDGSTIQRRHGGAWNLLWRLPIIFACPTHERLLRHTCPSCAQPVHARSRSTGATGGTNQMVPVAGLAGLHAGQCRAALVDPTTGKRTRVCGHRLDTPDSNPAPRPHAGRLDLQRHFLGLLDANGPAEVISVGQATTPSRYLVDLRILCCLIGATWRNGAAIADQPSHHLLDTHYDLVRRRIQGIRDSGRTVRELAIYDTPPLDAATSAELFGIAHTLLTVHDIDGARSALRPLLTAAPRGMPNWIRQFLAGDGRCTPGLQAALGLALGVARIRVRFGLPPTEAPPPEPPPRQRLRFGVRHIPQHLLSHWYVQHLEPFADQVKPRLLRRAAAARLAQLCVGGRATDAARQLGIPREATKNALDVVKHQLSSRRQREFADAVDDLAEELSAAQTRTDYGARRDVLAAWSLADTDWQEIVHDLRQRPEYDRRGRWPNSPYIDWGEHKRRLASAWIWVRVTRGEHIFAPAVRPNLEQTRRGNTGNRTIFSRWELISADEPTGHWADLRHRLDTYADELTLRIDTGDHPRGQRPRHLLLPSRR